MSWSWASWTKVRAVVASPKVVGVGDVVVKGGGSRGVDVEGKSPAGGQSGGRLETSIEGGEGKTERGVGRV